MCALSIACGSGHRPPLAHDGASDQRSVSAYCAREYHGPVALADRATQTLFYVESDGRHVSAVGFDGSVLWTRDLYSDVKRVVWSREKSDHEAELERLFRGDVSDRKIVSIERAEPQEHAKACLSITFSSGDFGVIDATSGKFIWLGRD